MQTWLIVPALILSALSSNVHALSDQESDFVAEMRTKHGFNSTALAAHLNKAKYQDSIIKAITRPAEGLEWYKYRKIFLQPDRIDAGVKFLRDNQEILSAAEKKYGVDPLIITAIIGVETKYGRITGNYRVIDALKTLAFSYPKRSDFFRGQLEEFFLMTREEEMNPHTPKGSYAGAMGMPQFIPSSFRSYAVDFDQNGRRDLWNSHADIIGSVANYFAEHGWQSGEAVAYRLDKRPVGLTLASARGEDPSIPISRIRESGIEVDSSLSNETNVAILELQQQDYNEYWLGLKNFYVITRYNHSNLYAMAVFQLSEAIRKRSEHGANH